jgi:hypothetical protein
LFVFDRKILHKKKKGKWFTENFSVNHFPKRVGLSALFLCSFCSLLSLSALCYLSLLSLLSLLFLLSLLSFSAGPISFVFLYSLGPIRFVEAESSTNTESFKINVGAARTDRRYPRSGPNEAGEKILTPIDFLFLCSLSWLICGGRWWVAGWFWVAGGGFGCGLFFVLFYVAPNT